MPPDSPVPSERFDDMQQNGTARMASSMSSGCAPAIQSYRVRFIKTMSA